MPRPHAILPACLLTGALLTGCGSEGETLRVDRPIVRFELAEYRIAPQNVTVRPGRLKIEARNTGRLTHNLSIQREEEVDGDDEWVEIEGGRVETMQPGRRAEAIKVTLAPGEYRLVCTIANHDDLGQYGELHVEE